MQRKSANATLGENASHLVLNRPGTRLFFSLDGKEYVIQTEAEKSEQNDLVMYQYKPVVKYLCRVPNGESAITTVLNSKCFNGCSFLDLLESIHVNKIF